MREMTKVAKDFRLQQWIQEVKECQSRPKGMTVAQWCDLNGVKRDNYYKHYLKNIYDFHPYIRNLDSQNVL